MKDLLLTIFYKFIDVFVTWYTIIWTQKFYKIKKGDVVLDIGGYFGGFAVYASKKVGQTGKVFCFEPDPRNLRVLKERIKHTSNIILIEKALSDKKGKINLSSNFSLSSIISQSQKDSVAIEVETSTLDEEMKKYSFSQINLMKMNIEGAEIKAISGAQTTLKKIRNFVIASHRRNGQNTADILKPILEKTGFKTKINCKLHKNLYGFIN